MLLLSCWLVDPVGKLSTPYPPVGPVKQGTKSEGREGRKEEINLLGGRQYPTTRILITKGRKKH